MYAVIGLGITLKRRMHVIGHYNKVDMDGRIPVVGKAVLGHAGFNRGHTELPIIQYNRRNLKGLRDALHKHVDDLCDKANFYQGCQS
jgi:hypothetical protein